VFAADDISVLTGQQADRASVLAAMPRCGVLYFAGHALAAVPPDSALESRLFVADGDISVRDLLQEDLHRMRLAVLSACESARVSAELPDEVVALPASLMQAGAAGVVGCLWPVRDRLALRVMRSFAELWHVQQMPPAEALCQAQRLVRGDAAGRPQPLAWAAFTFTGA
jgi:CHAT domain-containing protein